MFSPPAPRTRTRNLPADLDFPLTTFLFSFAYPSLLKPHIHPQTPKSHKRPPTVHRRFASRPILSYPGVETAMTLGPDYAFFRSLGGVYAKARGFHTPLFSLFLFLLLVVVVVGRGGGRKGRGGRGLGSEGGGGEERGRGGG